MKNVNKINAICLPIIALLYTFLFVARIITYNREDIIFIIINCLTAILAWVAAVLNIYKYKKNK